MATVLSVALAVQTIYGLRSVITDFLNHTQVLGPKKICRQDYMLPVHRLFARNPASKGAKLPLASQDSFRPFCN